MLFIYLFILSSFFIFQFFEDLFEVNISNCILSVLSTSLSGDLKNVISINAFFIYIM